MTLFPTVFRITLNSTYTSDLIGR